MPYAPIPLPDGVPPNLRNLVEARVDPLLTDVRMMLSYPRAPGDAGFNLTAVPALCSVIGGLSRVFFSATHHDGTSFRKVALCYPLSDEPVGAIASKSEFATALYHTYRNNLVHSLGLGVKWSGKLGRHRRIALRSGPKVVRHRYLPNTEDMLDEIELPDGRPDWLPPTLRREGKAKKLCVDALYWGVRRLVVTLCSDMRLRESSNKLLGRRFGRPAPAHRTAQPPVQSEVQSSVAPSISIVRAGQGWTPRGAGS
jgi:hypothetical protein